ncbi:MULTISPECIES: acyl-CoA carboxylase subunit epsilon [unclassified Streptomyces]|uniref:acyl-CoA carboxylase subunit epsilon n=1 Tax=unclassified Streptomyces TaxID=2593676 RepID=UPI000DAD9649|nr:MULTISPECIES: acyl-CoA carboxylase subunit epsilon [unclassified Streptomyces]PZT71634.1 acyl-CoA carboxylase subunit epsilon [Streptomyces sp. AC1-42T]PZT73240.1 acyl-CoA carboxylase subunit epsilon [Streptomyces sp. AC1-42W]
MGDFDTVMPAFRVERGHADDEELAAVAVVLCVLLAGREDEAGDAELPEVPPWRPERPLESYCSPYSWR